MTNTPTKFKLYMDKKEMKLITLLEDMIKNGNSVSYQTLHSVFHGYSDPKKSTMQKICDTLGVELSTIF